MKKYLILSLSIILTSSCNRGTDPGVYSADEMKDDVDEQEDAVLEVENDAPDTQKDHGITLSPYQNFEEFPEAALALKSPKDRQVIENPSVPFEFKVSNYELKAQSPEAGDNQLANSQKGQHIHLIVNNAPYSAHYQSQFTKKFDQGTHYAIAFLSRSYHLSVKNPKAYQVFQFTVEEATGEDPKIYDLDEACLFYSRPKGTYEGEATKRVLLDFYLHNAELKPDGYSVLAIVNDSATFEIDKWQPYVLEGLPMGENTISLELVDAKGGKVNPEINRIERTFTLKP